MGRWRNDKIGKRPPVEPLSAEQDVGYSDPAAGEPVSRCDECGLPDLPGNRVIAGAWSYRSVSFPFRLCEREIRRRYPIDPRDGDPLAVVA